MAKAPAVIARGPNGARSPVGIQDEPENELPYRFELRQNYPDRFNPVTMIEVFNVPGQKVRTLVNEMKSAGSYRIEWNSAGDVDGPASTGIYLCRFTAGDVVQTKKMLLPK